MSLANADQRVLGYLGRGLSLELSAVQLYTTQARLVDTWGLAEVAGKLSAEASEELEHAERIISRMLALGVAPNASQLRPVKLGRDLQELLAHDYAFEEELVTLYSEACNHCRRIGDHDNRLFFEALLSEEQAHAVTLKDWLQQLQ
ncbi:MAG: ferritin-like domain-containing protein [Gammaproteobacteria bacterium]